MKVPVETQKWFNNYQNMWIISQSFLSQKGTYVHLLQFSIFNPEYFSLHAK